MLINQTLFKWLLALFWVLSNVVIIIIVFNFIGNCLYASLKTPPPSRIWTPVHNPASNLGVRSHWNGFGELSYGPPERAQVVFHSGTARHMDRGCELSSPLFMCPSVYVSSSYVSCQLLSVCFCDCLLLFCLSCMCVEFVRGQGERSHHLLPSRRPAAPLSYGKQNKSYEYNLYGLSIIWKTEQDPSV